MELILAGILGLGVLAFSLAFICGPKAPIRSDIQNITGVEISPYTAALIHRKFVDENRLTRARLQELQHVQRDRENLATARFRETMDRSLNGPKESSSI